MNSIIFVCGLPYSMGDSQLFELFSPHGGVKSAWVVVDRLTGKSRGFGFVEMSQNEEAQEAIGAWNNTVYEGQTLFVIETKPQVIHSERNLPFRWKGSTGITHNNQEGMTMQLA
jgi:cold-inducible RNA-binding protein